LQPRWSSQPARKASSEEKASWTTRFCENAFPSFRSISEYTGCRVLKSHTITFASELGTRTDETWPDAR